MKTLFLLRHAKSDWSAPDLIDDQRPLNDRGKRVAPGIGEKLHELGVFPDTIICSTAARAVETLNYAGQKMKIDFNRVAYTNDLYGASTGTLLSLICGLEEETDSAMLVGHNPGLTAVAEYLTGNDFGDIPTCGAVKINFNLNLWKGVSKSYGSLEWFIYPKKFNL